MKKHTRFISVFLCSVLLAGCVFPGFRAFPSRANAAETLLQPGDVDGDGAVSAADARLALRGAVGLENYAEGSEEFYACDVDASGAITAADARLILRAAVGLEEFGKAVRTVLTPENTACDGEGFSFDAGFLDVEEPKTLTVREIRHAPALLEAEGAAVYDFELSGTTELEGIAQITLPYTPGKDTIPVAAYYNPESGEWEPVNYRVEDSKVIINTSHLSTYGVFDVSKEFTRNAVVKYNYSSPDLTAAEAAALLTEPFKEGSTVAEYMSHFAEQWGTASGFGLDIGYNLLQGAGYEISFITELGDLIPDLGLLFAGYHAICQGLEGKGREAVAEALKASHNYVVGIAAGLLKSAVLNVSLAGVAVFDYLLNKFYESVTNQQQDKYRNAYRMYYATKTGPGYRSPTEWFKVLWPYFRDGNLTPDEVNAKVKAEVDAYVNKFWNLSDGTLEEYYLKAEEQGKKIEGFRFLAGLSEELIEEINNEHRANLYNGFLVPVMTMIQKKLEDKAFFAYCDKVDELAKLLNRTVTLKITDSGAKNGKSAFADCTVRFAELPEEVKDAEQWKVKLDNAGTGKISFTVFSTLSMKIAPKLEVLDPRDPEKVLGSFSVTYNVPQTTVDLAAKDVEPPEDPNRVPFKVTPIDSPTRQHYPFMENVELGLLDAGQQTFYCNGDTYTFKIEIPATTVDGSDGPATVSLSLSGSYEFGSWSNQTGAAKITYVREYVDTPGFTPVHHRRENVFTADKISVSDRGMGTVYITYEGSQTEWLYSEYKGEMKLDASYPFTRNCSFSVAFTY